MSLTCTVKTQTLAWDLRAPSRARLLVRTVVCPHVSVAVTDVAELLISELVTNAVRHGLPPLVVQIGCSGDGTLELRVSDSSRDEPALRRPALSDIGGRGVALVNDLSDAWGVDLTDAGKTVWAHLSTPIPT